ncbi:extracellular solute-binding protein [Paenibacillus sp. J5C_2022]|nr:extracellular solute-binding protein [Paenibacillus sp. J5C2022]
MSNDLTSKKWKKWTATGMTLALATGLLAGCSGGDDPGKQENQVVRIGVLYGGPENEPYFRQQYTDMYEMMNPNVQFEIVTAVNYDDQRYMQQKPGEEVERPNPYEEMKNLMTGNNPVDVVVIDYGMLRRFTQDNLLQPLDPLIQKDKFDLTDYVDTVIEGIKQAGDNQIFALTPTFTSSALYYNKKIFADNNIEPPQDKMQWADILNLARQVSSGEGEDRTFGFSFNRWSNDGFSSVMSYSESLQLKMWDDKGEKMLVNTDGWADAWDTVYKLYQEDIVPDEEFMQIMYNKMASSDGSYTYDPFGGDLFLKGKVAMTIDGYYYINELRRANDNADKIENFEMVDWDVVTVPTHSSAPDIGGNIYLSQLMGINTKSPNPEGAWDFIKFSNSEDWARLKSRSLHELVARKEFLKPIAGMDYNVNAFTTLKPIPPSTVDEERIYQDNPGIWDVQNVGREMFQKVMSGEMDTRQALAEWEVRGNEILQRIPGADGGVIEPMPMPRVTEEEVTEEVTEEVPAEDTAAEASSEASSEDAAVDEPATDDSAADDTVSTSNTSE